MKRVFCLVIFSMCLAVSTFGQAKLTYSHEGKLYSASLYRAFRPEKARELIERFELHYTSKHASWLNVSECELSTMTRQCLNRRIPDRQTLSGQLKAWE